MSAPPKRLKRYRGWIALGTLVAVAAGVYLVTRNTSDSEQTVTYETQTVTTGTVTVTVSGTGSLEIDGATDVWPSVSGTVAEVRVTEGSVVTTGDVLFTLDSTSVDASIAQALAAYRKSEQAVVNAESQLLRAQAELDAARERSALATPTATSTDVLIAKKAVEAANIGLQSAKSERGSALAEYEDAREATGDLSVTAPCSGIVWSLTVSKGDAVQTKGASSASSSGPAASGDSATSGSSSAPVTIAPEEPLAVHLAVNEVDVPSLRVGQRAEIELDALPDFVGTGKVYEIARSATSSSGVVTFDVWVSLDVASEEMRPGMSAAATIVTDIARDVLVVPNSAVHPDGTGGYYVLVLDAGASEPRKVTVKTGLASATETQIVSGLGAGDVVVTQTVDSSADSGQQQFGPGGGGMMMGIDRGVPHD